MTGPARAIHPPAQGRVSREVLDERAALTSPGPCPASPALPQSSHFAVVTSPVLIILFPPQGVPVKSRQTPDDPLWSWPIPAPRGHRRRPGSPKQPQAQGQQVSLAHPCGAPGEQRATGSIPSSTALPAPQRYVLYIVWV